MRALFAAVIAALVIAMPATAQTGVATVDFEDQESDGTSVVVASTTMSNGGFLTIHDDTLLDGDALGSVVGVSEYLGPGPHTDVTVQVENVGTGEVTLIAMPHFDTNDNQEYDFVTSNGTEDGPYTDGDQAVTDDATVTIGSSGNNTGNNTTSPGDREGREGQTSPAEGDEDTPMFGAVALLAMLAIAVSRRR